MRSNVTKKENKQAALRHLARLEGQVRGIARMIEEDRYCVDIINQTAAARSAVSKVKMLVLKDHADDCVENAIAVGDKDAQREKFRELVEIFGRVCGG